jgi:hypothetical protein
MWLQTHCDEPLLRLHTRHPAFFVTLARPKG